MSAANGHGGRDAGAAVAAARPIMLVRYRPGVVGETARVVHVVALPTDEQAGVVGAWCGAALMARDIETVTPGEGMPCTVCVVTHVMGAAPAEKPLADGLAEGPGAGLAAGGACYQQWGWPVILHRDQVRLSLSHDVSALAIPIPLVAEVTQILNQRRCAPPVLAHPYAPDHHILLTGERYGVTLPCPAQVHQVTGVLLLPPTVTARGPITWIQPPRADSLRLCREIDLFGALRTALGDSAPRDPLPGGDPP
ncbi:MAG: hypothetical protein ACRDSZ_22140 [Pseudonocardiaceae bacterium]